MVLKSQFNTIAFNPVNYKKNFTKLKMTHN